MAWFKKNRPTVPHPSDFRFPGSREEEARRMLHLPEPQPGQPPAPQPGQPEQQISIGNKCFMDKLGNKEFLKVYKKISALLILMQTHLRLTETNEQSLLEYLGFNEEVIFKYLWAIFIAFNRQQFRSPQAIVGLLRITDTEGNMNEGCKGPTPTFIYALGMEQLDEQAANGRLNRFEHMLKQLPNLMRLIDIDTIINIVRNILNKEQQIIDSIQTKIWSLPDEQIDEAANRDYPQPVDPAGRLASMQHDIGILDRIIDQNGGDLTINLREVLHPNQGPHQPTPQPTPQPAAQPAPQPAPQPPPPQPAPQPAAQPAAQPEEIALDGDEDFVAWEEVEEDATEPDATMPNHEPATENTGINLAELSEKCDADPELKIALENLNVIFVVLKRSAELDPEEKLKILLNIKIPCNNITLFGSDMERTDKKTVAEFIIDHFGITDIDALTAKVMEIDQQCKKDEGAYALLTDLLKKDTATDDGPQTDEQPSPQPANDEPNTQWLEESDPFDELAEMTGDEPILPPAPKPAPKPESEPNIEDDPFSEDNIVGGD